MEVVHVGKWLEIRSNGQSTSGKTFVFGVYTKPAGEFLGVIRWYGAWRKYAFFPETQTLYEQDCLRDIAQFLEDAKNLKVNV